MPRIDPRVPALVALVSAALAFIGVYQTWLRIDVVGIIGPGSAQTGWEGRDGVTVAVTAGVVAVVALALLAGREDPWLRHALVIGGAIVLVIAVVNGAGAGSKANDIHNRYGLATGDVHAQLGAGIWLIGVAGLGILAAALLAHHAHTSPLRHTSSKPHTSSKAPTSSSAHSLPGPHTSPSPYSSPHPPTPPPHPQAGASTQASGPARTAEGPR